MTAIKILIKGAGDLATGIAWRLHRCGCAVLMTEIERPTTVRRTVAFSSAVYEGRAEVEGVTARLVQDVQEAWRVIDDGKIPVLVDPPAACKAEFRPDVLVDAVIAKKNTGTKRTDAPLVIGVGPGFCAGQDCDLAVETMRGHTLGKVIEEGCALPNTGVPGEIGGFGKERLIRALAAGTFLPRASIGDRVEKGQIVAECGGVLIPAQMSGVVRGMLKEGLEVEAGMKCGDIDGRCQVSHCFSISDKARAIGGGVLEAVLYGGKEKGYVSIHCKRDAVPER